MSATRRVEGIDDVIMLIGTPNADATVRVKLKDANGYATLVSCTSLPTGKAGYAIGCDLTNTTTGARYYNSGTVTSATWSAVGVVGAGSVLLANLATGIAPSHVVKYAGTITWSGSGASLATTITGVAATDILSVTIQTAPTQAAYVKSAAATLNTVTITLSAANTSNDAVIYYQVLRAAS